MKGGVYMVQSPFENTQNNDVIEMHDLKIVTDNTQPE
jgi:hypothetical protein